MRRGPDLLTTMVFVAAMVLGGVRAWTQEGAPDPKMLLNLDLFAARSNLSTPGPGAGDDSMLSQIRALRALGYFNEHGASASQPVVAAQPPPPYLVPGPPPSICRRDRHPTCLRESNRRICRARLRHPQARTGLWNDAPHQNRRHAAVRAGLGCLAQLRPGAAHGAWPAGQPDSAPTSIAITIRGRT